MLLPKLPSHQKQKLVLNESRKPFIKTTQNNQLQLHQRQQKENGLIHFKENQQHISKVKRSHSSSSQCSKNIFRHSLISRKIELNDKSNRNSLKIKKDQAKIVQRPSQRKNLKIHNFLNSDAQQSNSNSFGHFRQLSSNDKAKMDKIVKNGLQQKNNFSAQRPEFSQIAKISSILNESQIVSEQNQFSGRDQNSIDVTKSDIPSKNYIRNSICRHSKKNSRIINNSLHFDYQVFSLRINSGNVDGSQALSNKRVLLVQELAKDPDFQWKYQKFKNYCHHFIEAETELKQKLSILQYLTENLQLIKQRILPFKSFKSLTQIVQLLKPTMSQKQQSAYETKMQMLQWKTKFFTNVLRIKDNFSSAIDKKSKIVVEKFNLNQNVISEVSDFLAELQRKETVIHQGDVLSKFKNLLQKMVLNQKQMIDQIQTCQRETEFLFDKFNSIEQEWSLTFDIFNSTLENCANKCMILAQVIEGFYGNCSGAMFLTKGFSTQNPIDARMIQNDNCYICKWNQVKLKKIIQQNSLAKDHLLALRHLIAS